ncbi:MAG: hypothetical protein LUC27_07960, partial [Lachnospiraceae bacterium]|nr:hypothetical protein [Lachnospiraceae bacterium]
MAIHRTQFPEAHTSENAAKATGMRMINKMKANTHATYQKGAGRLALLLLAAAVLLLPVQIRADDGEQDYILGRPMTEEEIEEQQEQEPEELTEFPELDITLPEKQNVYNTKYSLTYNNKARTDSMMTDVKNQ